MKPAIFCSFNCDIPFADAVSLIADAGFPVVALGARPEYSGCGTAAGNARIRRLLQARSLTVDSIHAPLPQADHLFSLADDQRRESIRQCRLAAETAVDLGAGILVIHLMLPYDIPHGPVHENMVQAGRQSIAEVAESCASRGLRLAFENGQRRDYDMVLKGLLAEFHAPHVGLCYDSGHENVQGACFRLLEELGERLFTVHLHDNCGSDTHTLPCEGTIDWDRFRQVFHALDYSGNLLLEVSQRHSAYKDPQEFLCQAREQAERLLRPLLAASPD